MRVSEKSEGKSEMIKLYFRKLLKASGNSLHGYGGLKIMHTLNIFITAF